MLLSITIVYNGRFHEQADEILLHVVSTSSTSLLLVVSTHLHLEDGNADCSVNGKAPMPVITSLTLTNSSRKQWNS